MSISAQEVKKLREMSGAGMMDCKKALQETNGDLDEALLYLQKKGSAAAAKKASRTAAEGRVQIWTNDDSTEAVMVEVNCETDFVSRNENFLAFVERIAKTIGESGVETVEALADVTVADGEKSVAEYITDQIATIGENIKVRRFVRYNVDNGVVGPYIHAGDQLGVLVQLDAPADADKEALVEVARDVAMHIAAMKPGYLHDSDILAEDEVAHKEILVGRAAETGKPPEIVERMLAGQIKKWRAESVLVSQAFVKNSDTTVGEFVKSNGASVASFVRFEVGEGITKEEKSLSEEVAEQLRGS